MDKFPLSWLRPHSHVWFDPGVPPIQRRPVSPMIGDGPRMMRPGHTYRCYQCGTELTVTKRPEALRKC